MVSSLSLPVLLSLSLSLCSLAHSDLWIEGSVDEAAVRNSQASGALDLYVDLI